MDNDDKRGFTLIELVVVIAILGILAGIAIPRFLDASATARGARILADMKTMDDALSIYYVQSGGTYPAIVSKADGSVTGGDYLTTNDPTNKKYKLMASIPKPITGIVIFPCKPDTKVTISSDALYVVYGGSVGFLNPNLPAGVVGLTAGSIQELSASDLAAGGKGW